MIDALISGKLIKTPELKTVKIRKLTKKQLKELENREKKKVLFHEYGHCAVFSCFGGFGKVSIWRNRSGSIEEKSWLGNYEMFCNPGEVELSSKVKEYVRYMPPPKNWEVLVGMAGFVAEQIADDQTDGEEIFYNLQYAIGAQEISQTDLAMIGKEWGYGDGVECVLKILLDRWDIVERHVNLDEKCLF